ncbi:hypothetical protein EON67_02300 [archaeon]|nr:MAG: hypothetical protein EON67_02300 [archaeon]
MFVNERAPCARVCVWVQAIIKNADMSEDMQQDAVDCGSQALEKFNIEKDIAACTCWLPHARTHACARATPHDCSASCIARLRTACAACCSRVACVSWRVLVQTLRRSSTKSTAPRGTASWAATLAAM